MITVKQLREALEGLDDDTPVVVPAPDHEFRHVGIARKLTALTRENAPGWLYEDYGDNSKLDENDFRIDIFLVE